MLDALEAYRDAGGGTAYLGGNDVTAAQVDEIVERIGLMVDAALEGVS